MRIQNKLAWLFIAGILVGALEVFSLAGLKLPAPLAIPFFFTLIVLVGHQTILKGLKALFSLNFGSINLLVLIALIGAFYLGEYEEAAVVIVLFTLAEKLEDFGIAKSKGALDELVEKMPKVAHVKGEDQPVPIDQVKLGQVLLIKPHEMIPLDSEVVKGGSFVDESTITGEPLPSDKRVGDHVFAGTLNKQGHLEVTVTKLAKESTLAKIRELTFNATKTKAKTQKFIEKFSTFYTPAILFLTIAWLTGSTLLFGRPFDTVFAESLSLLVIACPCALVISTPISIFSAIGSASSQGALIKGGRYLEAIGRVKMIAFDKTRTLTYGEPIVTDVIPFGEHTVETVLACAAGVEVLSEHPLAQSVVEEAKRRSLSFHQVENFESVVGKGAKANCLVCFDKKHTIGKLSFILEEHTIPETILKKIHSLQDEGKTVIVISTHEEVEGLIAIEDKIREEAPESIQKLDKLKVSSSILTGDHELTAKNVAKEIGISQVRAELLPEDKLHAIEEFKNQYGVVAMVGDGVNDAPALALADVGISMSSLGSDTALEAASIVVMSQHLTLIPKLITLGRRTLSIIQWNTTFAIGVKLLVIALSLGGITNLAMAIFADVGVTCLVILNSLRLLRTT